MVKNGRRQADNFRWAQRFLERRGYRYRFQWVVFHALLKEYVPPDGVWVDLGCGDNRWLERVHARDRLGVDLVVHNTLRDRRFVRADVYNLPFGDSRIDALSARFVVEHLAAPAAFFAEAARALKPGGSLVIQTTNVGSPPIFILSLIPYGVKRRLIAFLAGARQEDVFPTYYRFNKPNLFHEGVAGFALIEFVLHTGVNVSRRTNFLMAYFYERITDAPSRRRLKANISAVYRKL